MSMTLELRKFVAPEIITGSGARLLVGRYIAHFAARKPMVLTDKAGASLPWFSDVLRVIEEESGPYVVFDEITPTPRDLEVMRGAELFLAEKCDLIIAIGGGSPIDCAKGISIVSTNGGSIMDYEGVDEVDLPGPPLICIPSTAGAAADVSQFAIIRHTASMVKKAIISKKLVPDLALIDPMPLTTMDAYLTACTGMDALTHAIEAYASNAHSHLTDVHALDAIHTISAVIEKAVSPDRDLETMNDMMHGCLQAGLAFSNASLGAVHAMSHSLGGFLDLPHGECNSILLEHVIAVNFESALDRYREVAHRMGIPIEGLTDDDAKKALLDRISSLRHRIGIGDYAHVAVVNDTILDILTDGALSDPCMVTNPKPLSREEVRKIYADILRDR